MINDGFRKDIWVQINKKGSHICVGLDTDFERLPKSIKSSSVTDSLFQFNKFIIDATHDICTSYKANVVFYAAYGLAGLEALQKTNEYIKSTYDMPTIADCKRSEMLRSAEMTAKELFETFSFDAFTATPWFGYDTLEPYQAYAGKAVFVLCHDSNPTAGEVQDVELKDGKRLYHHVTDLVCNRWNTSGNILIEAPLTYPKILKEIKDMAPKEQFFLLAGLGAQGGNIEDLRIFKDDKNFIINASRSVIYASPEKDFATKARNTVLGYNEEIQFVLDSSGKVMTGETK